MLDHALPPPKDEQSDPLCVSGEYRSGFPLMFVMSRSRNGCHSEPSESLPGTRRRKSTLIPRTGMELSLAATVLSIRAHAHSNLLDLTTLIGCAAGPRPLALWRFRHQPLVERSA